MKIYIVRGRSGRYEEEFMEWDVCAYTKKETAEKKMKRCADQAEESYKASGGYYGKASGGYYGDPPYRLSDSTCESAVNKNLFSEDPNAYPQWDSKLSYYISEVNLRTRL